VLAADGQRIESTTEYVRVARETIYRSRPTQRSGTEGSVGCVTFAIAASVFVAATWQPNPRSSRRCSPCCQKTGRA
jgi:hypothetical protein